MEVPGSCEQEARAVNGSPPGCGAEPLQAGLDGRVILVRERSPGARRRPRALSRVGSLLSTSSRSGEISVQELKERMGHASLDTTQRYIDEADVVETVAARVIDDILGGAKPKRRSLRAI
jgi:hypothetical protein